jgi:hypothetical protein
MEVKILLAAIEAAYNSGARRLEVSIDDLLILRQEMLFLYKELESHTHTKEELQSEIDRLQARKIKLDDYKSKGE